MGRFLQRLTNSITIFLIEIAIDRVHSYPFNGYENYDKEVEILENLNKAKNSLETLDW